MAAEISLFGEVALHLEKECFLCTYDRQCSSLFGQVSGPK